VTYGWLFLRGFVLVSLVAANTTQIAQRHFGGAFIVGMGVSLVWWWNSSSKRPEIPGAAFAYAVGAACGTVTGMYLAGR
jgi:hypothetical protein